MSKYTAISFAPVQGFIEKSRKLRDLYGASLILSYLSQKLAEAADQPPDLIVISPALINVQEGMPNRILIKGDFNRNEVTNTLIKAWEHVLVTCQTWLEQEAFPQEQFCWQVEWLRWKQYTWEIFWGQGSEPDEAMLDLERRKLKRDWTGINWVGESSSLSGTDAIAGPRLGEVRDLGKSLTPDQHQQFREELELFYRRLSWLLDAPDERIGKPPLSIAALKEYEESKPDDIGKYIAINERLSIPELVKRLVTYTPIAETIGMTPLGEGFTEIKREANTGWFMGDGDKVGDKLKTITSDEEQTIFSKAMRDWGKAFKKGFPRKLGRVVYAGGDDFLGILYNSELKSSDLSNQALVWLKQFDQQWQTHGQNINVSMGFVWAANRVPQRDVLQHCREAEKIAKNKGRDRVTIRVLFNSGQFVQWTCPWQHLPILDRCRNWTHLYNDWAHLRSRHAIRFREVNQNPIDRDIALAMLDLYFDDLGQEIQNHPQEEGQWRAIAGDNTDAAVVQWIHDLVQVGWQLCSNT
ncbi:Cas10/Cmr2 second palm domain-containing protein [Myxacorys almedinensis]|uniref:CRISPR-associated protein Cmr2 n=1 Tax=Myxacorys almedinensis A TaxID=2690445 RepID=A0A8J7Z2C1_9CYAN|nr:type III-B CRISPR-associated protein Cas10/Cmr2 [Myxacorys almedinensis]NDJ17980.1 CRISPR-associated protein Cmr2 [Myxacorys almedinensis A]